MAGITFSGEFVKTATVVSVLIATGLAHAQAIEAPDSDGDGINDARDNCLLVSNADQRDTNDDGYGNACDMDLNNDNIVNFIDLGLLRSVFFSANPDADANGDGVVNFTDLGVLRAQFFQAPGPTRFVTFVASSGNWAVAENWKPARVPTVNDHVLLDAMTGLVELSDQIAVSSLQARSGFLLGFGDTFAIGGQLLVNSDDDLGLERLAVTVGESVVVNGEMRVGAAHLGLAGESAFEIGAGGLVTMISGTLELPTGVEVAGAMWLDSIEGTLGPIGGAGEVTLLNTTLRLVGTHDGRFLSTNNNVFTLAGDILASQGSTPQLVMAADTWDIESSASIAGVQLISNGFALEAPAQLTLTSTFLEGTMTVAPGAELALHGSNSLFSFDVMLAAPVTSSQAAPALSITGTDPSIEGFGSIVLPAAALPGVATTVLTIDGAGGDISIDQNIDLVVQRSLDMDVVSPSRLVWEGSWTVDGSAAPATDLPTLSVDGEWRVQGAVDVTDGQLVLDGSWFVQSGISATRAEVALLGQWMVGTTIGLTDNSIVELDISEFTLLPNVSLNNSTARISGTLLGNTLEQLTGDAQSRIEFSGDYGQPFFGSTLVLNQGAPAFVIEEGAQMINVDVTGTAPLRVRGGVLNFVGLGVDTLIENGANVTFGSPFLVGANMVMLADDAPTRLNLVNFEGQPSLRGFGEIQFAGTAGTDDLNILNLEAFQVPVDDQTLVLRTVSTGGRVVPGPANPFTSFSLGMSIALEASFRDVTIDADVGVLELAEDIFVGANNNLIVTQADTVLIDDDVHLGVGATFETDAAEISVIWDLTTPRVLSFDLGGPDSFGRFVTPEFPRLLLDGLMLAPVLVDDYTPANCTEFFLTDFAFINAAPFGLDTAGLNGFSAELLDDDFVLRLRVFDTPNCTP